MRRTLPLLAVIAACGAGLAYGLPAASGSTAPTTPAEYHLGEPEREVEPTGRTYLAAPAQPATAAPSSSTVITPTPTRQHMGTASGTTAVETPAPVAVAPQPVPVVDPAPEDNPTGDPCFRVEPECYEAPEPDADDPRLDREPGDQLPEEVIGSYRCPDPLAIVVRLDVDGSLVCEVQP